MRPEAKTLVRELRKQIKRPAARKLRVERSANLFLGSQEITGICVNGSWMCGLVQRVGTDWLVTFKGQEGRAQKIGPPEAPALVEETDERGLDPKEFMAHLRERVAHAEKVSPRN